MAKPNEVSELEVIRAKNADEILQELFDEQKALHDRRRQEESEVVIKQSASGNGSEHKSADDILNELFTELGQKQPNDSIGSFLNSGKKKKKHKVKEKDKSKKKKDKEKVKKAKKKGECEESSKKRKRKDKSGSEDEKLDNKKKEKWDSGDDEQRGKSKMIRSDEESSKRKKSREKSSKGKARKHSTCAKDVDVEEGEIVDAKRGHSSKSRSHDRTESSDMYLDNAKGRRRRQSRSPSVSPVSKRVCPTRSGDKYDSCRDAKRRLSGSASNYGDGEFSKERSVRRAPPRSYDHHDNRFRDQSRTSPEPFHGLERALHSKYHGDRRRGRRISHEEYDRRGRPLSGRHSRSRSRSRSRRPYAEVFDKVKLLEIARRNATLLMKNGVLPTDIFSKDQIVAIKAGGKSVEELTSYCRRLARKEGLAEGDPDFSGPDSDGGEGGHFIHHPFVVKERPMPQITLNIRNAIPLPVRTPQELAIENAVRKTQFPVSSGTQHRYKEVKELEWKEVETPAAKEMPKVVQEMSIVPLSTPTVNAVVNEVEVVPIPLPPPQVPANPDFEPISSPVDVGSVITARLKAIRALKENPEDTTAKRELNSAVQEMDRWAEAKALEPKFLTVSELTTGPQAWAKRDQLKNAKEVASGMGMHLLQKMGWKPGEGLGKNKEGTTEPLALDVKTDKKGLTSQEDLKQKGPFANLTMLYDLSGKHPVSALMELCTKRRWGPPVFDLCFEHGPPHQKSFVFKVTVNGVEYQPCIATNNKKLAKANAAAFCLQSLGLLKTSPAPAATGTLQTVPAMPAVTVPDANFVASHQLQTVPNQ